MRLEYPEVVLNIDEIKALYDAEEIIGQNLENDIETTDKNTNITTSTELGIKRREEILGIRPQDTESLEDRTFRVLIKWFDSYPYTYKDLMERMDNLLGKGNYTIAIAPDEMAMICRLELTRKTMYDEFINLLEKIVPLNITMDISLRYNQHYKLNKYTHRELEKMTHEQIRNDVLEE